MGGDESGGTGGVYLHTVCLVRSDGVCKVKGRGGKRATYSLRQIRKFVADATALRDLFCHRGTEILLDDRQGGIRVIKVRSEKNREVKIVIILKKGGISRGKNCRGFNNIGAQRRIFLPPPSVGI